MQLTCLKFQLDRKITVVRSDPGCEFYGKYEEIDQNEGHFFSIIFKNAESYSNTMPGTPQ